MDYVAHFEKLQVMAATATGEAVAEISERGYTLWVKLCAAAYLGEVDAAESAAAGRAYGQLEQLTRQRRGLTFKQ